MLEVRFRRSFRNLRNKDRYRMNPRNIILRCATALCVMLAVFGLMGGTQSFAMSESADETQLMLEVGVSAKPDQMVAPDEALLTFTITNISEMDALNLYLSSADGLTSEAIGQIAAGDTQTFSRSHSVTEAELAAGKVSYIVSHDAPLQGSGRVDYTIHAAIEKAVAQPQAEFTRQFSSNYAQAGSMVSVIYRVRNTGNVALNTLQVRDKLGDFTGRIDHLEVGESRTLISRVGIDSETASSAMLSYCVDGQGETVHTQNLSEMPVQLAEAHIDAVLSAGYAAFSDDSAEVVLVLTNEGNVDYRDITITDDIYGGVIAGNVRILSGSDPVEISATYPLRETGTFRWQISGMSETGERVDFVTDTVTLDPIMGAEPSELRIWAETDTPRIRRSGNVEITVHIANEGNSAVENIVLSEPVLGEIREFAVIPSAGEIQRKLDVLIKENAEYQFRVDYTDADGWLRTADAEPLGIVIAPDGVLPEGSKLPLIEFTGASIKIGGSSLFGVLLVSACIVLIVLILILLIATRKARLEKHIRIAAERQRRREKSGSTGRRHGKDRLRKKK